MIDTGELERWRAACTLHGMDTSLLEQTRPGSWEGAVLHSPECGEGEKEDVSYFASLLAKGCSRCLYASVILWPVEHQHYLEENYPLLRTLRALSDPQCSWGHLVVLERRRERLAGSASTSPVSASVKMALQERLDNDRSLLTDAPEGFLPVRRELESLVHQAPRVRLASRDALQVLRREQLAALWEEALHQGQSLEESLQVFALDPEPEQMRALALQALAQARAHSREEDSRLVVLPRPGSDPRVDLADLAYVFYPHLAGDPTHVVVRMPRSVSRQIRPHSEAGVDQGDTKETLETLLGLWNGARDSGQRLESLPEALDVARMLHQDGQRG